MSNQLLLKTCENKYWITPEGDIIRIALLNIDEHFKSFNDTKEGRKFKNKYKIKNKINPENLYLTFNAGFIRVLVVNEIINISYTAVSNDEPIPICIKAVNSILSFLLCDNIKDVQYDFYINSESYYGFLSKKEFVKMLKEYDKYDKDLIIKI